MNIYLSLFLTFFEIGAVSFGGGYGMISLVREKMLAHGWLGEEELINMIAVSESTPGPIAVNMATFVGASQGGVLGAALATLGVVLPAFLIMLLICTLVRGLLRYGAAQAFLSGVRPAVSALILGTALTMGLKILFSLSAVSDTPSPDLFSLCLFALLWVIAYFYKKKKGKKPSPILMILFCAVCGILFGVAQTYLFA